MSFLKKAKDFVLGSKAPKYDMDQGAMNNQYGVQSSIGNMNIVKNADGTYSKNYETTQGDQYRNNLINQGLGSMSLDPVQTQQAYYDQASRLLNKQFDREKTSTDTNLINRGIQVGTEQYKNTMGDLTDRQNATLQDLANQAVYMGDQNIGQKIGNINALGSGRDVYGVSALGGQSNAYDQKYAADIYRNLNKDQRNSNAMQVLWEAPNSGFKSFTSGFFSDKRLKENLKPVGKLNNGLKVYVGNYKKETGLDTTPQLFLVAQEVEKKRPEAVGKRFGALTVDYELATKGK